MMKMPNIYPLVYALIGLSLSSCATKLTPTQKQKMTTVHMPSATTMAGAYASPNFTSSSDAATGSAMSGAVGFGLVGGILSEVVVAAERANDAKKNKASTDAIAKVVPQGLDQALTEELKARLKKDPFFGPRLSDRVDAPAHLRVTIKRYSLNSLDDVQFIPVIVSEMDLTVEGKSIRKKIISNPTNLMQIGMDVPRAPLTSYAADAKLLRNHFETSARQLADSIAADLAKAAAQ
jgi:hypothetical protein